MLKVTIPEQRLWDEGNEEFIYTKETNLQLEHSLISLKKWERKWHKPFLDKKSQKTDDEIKDYIQCMTLTPNVDPMIYSYIPDSVIIQVIDYIKDPMTATWFSNYDKIGAAKTSSEVVTAEIIYYWMITLNIPTEFQKWHLNELLTLIKVVNIKNGPKKKMPKHEAARRNAALNEARRAKHKSKG